MRSLQAPKHKPARRRWSTLGSRHPDKLRACVFQWAGTPEAAPGGNQDRPGPRTLAHYSTFRFEAPTARSGLRGPGVSLISPLSDSSLRRPRIGAMSRNVSHFGLQPQHAAKPTTSQKLQVFL